MRGSKANSMTAASDACQFPAVGPPAGVTSNFVNPPTLQPTVISILSIVVAWATMMSVIRLYSNFRKLRLDDYAICISICLSIAYCGVLFSQHKVFRHIWDIPACWYDEEFVKSSFVCAFVICSFLSHIGCFFAKWAIFLFYLKLFGTHRAMRIAIWTGMISNFVVYSIGIVIVTYYGVPQFGKAYLDAVLYGHVRSPLLWSRLESGLIALLNLYIFILPLVAMFRLRISIQSRLPLIAVFFLASMGITASIVSLAVKIPSKHAIDKTWIAAILCLCGGIEHNIAIIVNCAPAFAMTVQKLCQSYDLFGHRNVVKSPLDSGVNHSDVVTPIEGEAMMSSHKGFDKAPRSNIEFESLCATKDMLEKESKGPLMVRLFLNRATLSNSRP